MLVSGSTVKCTLINTKIHPSNFHLKSVYIPEDEVKPRYKLLQLSKCLVHVLPLPFSCGTLGACRLQFEMARLRHVFEYLRYGDRAESKGFGHAVTEEVKD